MAITFRFRLIISGGIATSIGSTWWGVCWTIFTKNIVCHFNWLQSNRTVVDQIISYHEFESIGAWQSHHAHCPPCCLCYRHLSWRISSCQRVHSINQTHSHGQDFVTIQAWRKAVEGKQPSWSLDHKGISVSVVPDLSSRRLNSSKGEDVSNTTLTDIDRIGEVWYVPNHVRIRGSWGAVNGNWNCCWLDVH